jgi:citrate synthase
MHALMRGRARVLMEPAAQNWQRLVAAADGLVRDAGEPREGAGPAPERLGTLYAAALAASALGDHGRAEALVQVLGASETAGKLFLRVEAEAAANHGGDLRAAAKAVVTDLRANKQIVPGYGHPEHKTADPRVAALFNLSAKVGGGQKYVELSRIIESVIPEVTGKDLPMNVSAAIPAVLLGVNFPVTALKGVPMLARVASLISHLNEEMADPIGFALANHAVAQQQYTGKPVKD